MSCKSISTALGAIALAASMGATAAHVAPAKAADIPDYDDSLKDTVVYAPAPIWTGIYVGVHAGYMWSEWDGPFSYDDEDLYPTITFDHSDKSIDGDDWMAGLQIGANYQSGRWVAGLETDVSWTGAEGDTTFVPYPVHLDPDNSGNPIWDVKTEVELFGTARGRLGYLMRNDLLVFATGGLAWAKIESSLDSIHAVDTPRETASHATSEDYHVGWTIGGGLEWMLAENWTMKGEYLYFDLGEVDYQFSGEHATDNYHPDLDGHIVRIGVNYLFGGRDEPVDSYK